MNLLSRRFVTVVCFGTALLLVIFLGVMWMGFQARLQSQRAIVFQSVQRLLVLEIEAIEPRVFEMASAVSAKWAAAQVGDPEFEAALNRLSSRFLTQSFGGRESGSGLWLMDADGRVRWGDFGQDAAPWNSAEWSRLRDIRGEAEVITEMGLAAGGIPVIRLLQACPLGSDSYDLCVEVPIQWVADKIDLGTQLKLCVVGLHSGDAMPMRLDLGSLEISDDCKWLESARLSALQKAIHDQKTQYRSLWNGDYLLLDAIELRDREDTVVGSLMIINDVASSYQQFCLVCIKSIGIGLIGTLLLVFFVPKYFSRYDQEIRRNKARLEELVKEKEIALHQLEERKCMFRNLFEGAPIPMIQIDYDTCVEDKIRKRYFEIENGGSVVSEIDFTRHPDFLDGLSEGYMERINTAAMDFFALSGVGNRASSIQWLVHASDDVFLTSLVRLIAKRQSFSSFECEMVPHHGAKHTVVVDFAIIKSGEDRECIMATFRDITEQRREHEAVLEAKEQAEEATRLKSSFFSNMTHELKTPLNAIIGFSDMLCESTTDASSLEQLKLIQTSGRHLLEIIKNILELTRIDADHRPLYFSLFGLQEFLADFMHPHLAFAKTKGLSLTHVTDQVPSFYVFCDQNKLHHVLHNVMDNALKFTHSGGIDVGARFEIVGPGILQRANDLPTALKTEIERVVYTEFEDVSEVALCRLRFTIEDTGMGIRDDFMCKIFEPFVQEDSTATRKYGGTGLGLTVCQKLVELMNGTITCENRSDGGTKVEVVVYGVTTLSGVF